MPLQPARFRGGANGALIVNAAILVLAAAVFFKHHVVVTEIDQAQSCWSAARHYACARVFAVALLASGQSSTHPRNLVGQIVMEGYLDLRMRPWMRRLITRTLAIIPAVVTIYNLGSNRP